MSNKVSITMLCCESRITISTVFFEYNYEEILKYKLTIRYLGSYDFYAMHLYTMISTSTITKILLQKTMYVISKL